MCQVYHIVHVYTCTLIKKILKHRNKHKLIMASAPAILSTPAPSLYCWKPLTCAFIFASSEREIYIYATLLWRYKSNQRFQEVENKTPCRWWSNKSDQMISLFCTSFIIFRKPHHNSNGIAPSMHEYFSGFYQCGWVAYTAPWCTAFNHRII